MPARLIVTKLVSGAASRNPPFSGWIFSKTLRLGFLASERRQTGEGIPGFPVVMPNLADCDQRGEGVTHHRQFDRFIKPGRQAGELERQRLDFFPIDQPREGAVREDRNRKGFVLAIAGDDRGHAAGVFDPGDRFFHGALILGSRFPSRETPRGRASWWRCCSGFWSYRPSRRRGFDAPRATRDRLRSTRKSRRPRLAGPFPRPSPRWPWRGRTWRVPPPNARPRCARREVPTARCHSIG